MMPRDYRELIGPEIVAGVPDGVRVEDAGITMLAGYVHGRLRRQGWTDGDLAMGINRRKNPAIRAKLDQLDAAMRQACKDGKLPLDETESTHLTIAHSCGLATKDAELDCVLAYVCGMISLVAAGKALLIALPAEALIAALQRQDPRSAYQKRYDPNAPHNQN